MPVAEAKAPSLRSVTEELLSTYWEQDQKRKALEREARQIASAQKLTIEQVQSALEAAEKVEITKGEFRAGISEVPGHVGWKDEFIKVAGHEAANAIQQAAAPSRRLTITKIGG